MSDNTPSKYKLYLDYGDQFITRKTASRFGVDRKLNTVNEVSTLNVCSIFITV